VRPRQPADQIGRRLEHAVEPAVGIQRCGEICRQGTAAALQSPCQLVLLLVASERAVANPGKPSKHSRNNPVSLGN
jgi:hypothetical protein